MKKVFKLFGFEIFTIEPKKERFLIICECDTQEDGILPITAWAVNEEDLRKNWPHTKELPIKYVIPYTSLT
jgi:hypothetical protein